MNRTISTSSVNERLKIKKTTFTSGTKKKKEISHQRGAGGGGAYGKYIPVTPCVGGGGGGALKNMVPFVIP